MYDIWIGNFFNQPDSKKIFTWKQNVDILGFVAFSFNVDSKIASINLLSVDNKARKKGIDSSLIKSVQIFLKEKGINELNVATQKHNLPACNLYENNFFNEFKDTYVYHIWN